MRPRQPLPVPRECRCGAVVSEPGAAACHACTEEDALRQVALTAHCARCGEPLHDDVELGLICGAAADSLDRRALVVPAGVRVALRLVEREMACRVGRCTKGAGR